MLSLRSKIGGYLVMGAMLIILSPLLISGLTLRYVDCHCDEMSASCNLPSESQSDGDLPACCRSEKPEMPDDHACQDECCVKELHLVSLDLDYKQPRTASIDFSQLLPSDDFLIGPIHRVSGLLCVSDKSPPTSSYGRTLLIQIHQLKISAPVQLLA